jgi:hypothetical protein
MTSNTVINAFASAALYTSQNGFKRVAVAKSSSVSCVLPLLQSLHVCHISENSLKLDELLAYHSSRDYKVLVGEFSYACYRKWQFVQFVSVIVSALEFLEVAGAC